MLYTTANINIVNNDTYIFLVLRVNTDRGRKHKVSISKRTTLCNFVYKKQSTHQRLIVKFYDSC